MVKAWKFDGSVAKYYHAKCFLESFDLKSVNEIDGFKLLRWEDQEFIIKYINQTKGKGDEKEEPK